jgi:hypothetical protein
MTALTKFGEIFLRIFGIAMVGILAGLWLLFVIVICGVKFNSWLVDALIVRAMAFVIFAALNEPLGKSAWITSGPDWMFGGLVVIVLLSGLGGAFVANRCNFR